MVAEDPEIAGLRPRCPARLFEGLVEVEALRPFALLTGLETPEQVLDLALAEPREREVEVGRRPEISEEPGEEGVVPGPADLVERQAQEARLLHADIQPGDRDRGQPEPPCCHEALVATDDGSILPASEDRLDEAELAQAALECVELVLADPARVGGIWTELIDRDLVDGQRREGGGETHALRSTTESCRQGWLTPATAPESAGRGSADETEIDVVRPLAPTKLSDLAFQLEHWW